MAMTGSHVYWSAAVPFGPALLERSRMRTIKPRARDREAAAAEMDRWIDRWIKTRREALDERRARLKDDDKL
jgi:GH24 family phage-related lysozyme (muramidase)